MWTYHKHVKLFKLDFNLLDRRMKRLVVIQVNENHLYARLCGAALGVGKDTLHSVFALACAASTDEDNVANDFAEL
jgi:hypothetical protein